MKLRSSHFIGIVALVTGIATAQVSTGMPPFGSFGGGPFDTINLGNLNVHFSIPVVHKAGRGRPFTYDLSYDSSTWQPVTSSGTTQWQPGSNWGWRGVTEVATGYISSTRIQKVCYPPPPLPHVPNPYLASSNWVYHDPFGAQHAFPGSDYTLPENCGGTVQHINALAGDGSGYTLVTTGLLGGTITSRGGKVLIPPFRTTTGAATSTDSNGNQITVNGGGQFFDTLSGSTPVLTVSSAAPPTPTTFTYTAPSGASAKYTMNYQQYTVKTGFSVTGVSEYGPLSNALVSSITLPDSSSYDFTYEKTPGQCTPLSGTYSANCVTARIASVTLPTGGTISYTYSGGSSGIESDGSAAGLVRTLNPGGQWQYSRALRTGSKPVGPGSTWTTTVIDPSGNYTVMNFAEDGTTTTETMAATYNFYETQRRIYQGAVLPANLLSTIIRCYNAVYAGCSTATVNSPITQTDVYTQLPNSNTRLSEILHNSFGLITNDKEYDYGVAIGSAPGTTKLVRETVMTYAALGNGIVNRPASVVVKDWTIGSPPPTTIATTAYSYDGTAPTATSGTPQHTSVTGSRGNLTNITTSTSSSSALFKSFSYYDTGTPNVATDVNGAQTTYVYGSGSCGNSFATTIQEPLGLSRSITWNCTGGVATQVIDENGKNAKTDYTDPYFWRPADIFDQASNETTIDYISMTEMETTLSFNSGTSVSDKRVTLDGLGRPMYTQNKQGPGASNYDTVQIAYDPVGNIPWISLPCSASASSYCPPGQTPANGWSYDALNRVTSFEDSGGRQTMYKYTGNDLLVTFGPAPTGENAKQREFEYDGLGRLASVCEISSTLSNVGPCGQGVSQTGYLTKYIYDALGRLLTVKQGAQPNGSLQTRTFVYDMLGRMTSETNPESGTTSYVYDSYPSPGVCGGWTSEPGDLMLVTKADGSQICYAHNDSFHRVTRTCGTGGLCQAFRYDNSQGVLGQRPSGVTVNNSLGRLVEAVTDTGASWPITQSSMITDEWFSYDARGEVIDVYELTPHSGGYYHATASYWPNGALQDLGLLNSSGSSLIPALTYWTDGEGRHGAVTASSGQNPVSSANYVTGNGTGEPVGALIGVNFGSGDSDSFTYDPNTGRMNGYTFFVNGKTDTGTLTWNANATLQKLVINDQIPGTSDSQTCNYLYDDLQRLSTTNCGALWAQNFSYDAFGNISKSVPPGSSGLTFAPLYSSGNQFTSIPGVFVKYDANGNLLTDNLNTYTWDAHGKMATVSTGSATVTNTYDALGRMVENNAGGSYTEFVYGPTGTKLATCNGQSLIKAFVGLPGGAKAIYNSSGLAYFRHSDWLGTSRLASTAARALYSSSAYAPFGEQYAKAGSPDASYTGQDQDTVSSLYDFPARRQSPSQGRWIAPDPGGSAVVSPTTPQTWNRYGYVLGNPLSYIDPLGLSCEDPTDGTPCVVEVTASFDPVPLEETFDYGAGGGSVKESPFLPLRDEGAGKDANCGITVKCRGIQANSLGKLGFQHCDAGVTDANGNQHSLSAGPDPPNQPTDPNTVLNAWDTPLDPSQFTGNTTFTSTSCSLAGCLINSTDQWNASPVKPLYGPTGISIKGWAPVGQSGENSNQWLMGTFQGCGVTSIGINQFGSIW